MAVQRARQARRPARSQHFLRDRGLAEELVTLAGISRRDLVLEIGAGDGAITSVARTASRICDRPRDRLLAGDAAEGTFRAAVLRSGRGGRRVRAACPPPAVPRGLERPLPRDDPCPPAAARRPAWVARARRADRAVGGRAEAGTRGYAARPRLGTVVGAAPRPSGSRFRVSASAFGGRRDPRRRPPGRAAAAARAGEGLSRLLAPRLRRRRQPAGLDEWLELFRAASCRGRRGR